MHNTVIKYFIKKHRILNLIHIELFFCSTNRCSRKPETDTANYPKFKDDKFDVILS